MARVKCSGELLPDEWADIYAFYGFTEGYFSPKTIQTAIDSLADGEDLTLEVNSPGGDVDAGNTIFTMLNRCNHTVNVEIESLAASAASYMIMAADHIAISIPAQMMIHRASGGCWGNYHDHNWAAKQLEVTDESILATYVSRCGEDHREELRTLMDQESFMGAEQCLELGLVDEILPNKASGTANVVASAFRNVIRSVSTLPDIRDLMARRDKAVTEARARLNLEKARFGTYKI